MCGLYAFMFLKPLTALVLAAAGYMARERNTENTTKWNSMKDGKNVLWSMLFT
jgi:hypothetical protein